MRKYNWFQKLGRSLVPGEFYIHILQEKMGRAIGYMLIFILILSISVGIYTGYDSKQNIDLVISDFESGAIPPASITDGQLTIAGDEAVTINYFNTFVVIDDGLNYDVKDVLAYDTYVLFHKEGVSIGSRLGGPAIHYAYDDIIPVDFTNEDIIAVLHTVSMMIIPIAVITQFLLSVLSFFFNSIFILLVGNILRTVSGLGLKLKQVYHMVIYAMTFSVFWTHFVTLLPKSVPMWLDNFVFYAIPSMLLVSVFTMIRKRAMDELEKK